MNTHLGCETVGQQLMVVNGKYKCRNDNSESIFVDLIAIVGSTAVPGKRNGSFVFARPE